MRFPIVFIAFAFFLSLPAHAGLGPEEIAEIETYLVQKRLIGTWKERAVRAFVRMEQEGSLDYKTDELRPELLWMSETMRELALGESPPVAALFKDIAESVEQLATQPTLRQGTLRNAMQLFSEALNFRGQKEIAPGRTYSDAKGRLSVSSTVIKWENRGKKIDRIPEESRRNRQWQIYWPCVPRHKKATDLELTQSDFIDLLPFPISPMELTIARTVTADGSPLSPQGSLEHDEAHVSVMASSWVRDAKHLFGAELGVDSAELRNLVPSIRRARRELVLQISRENRTDLVPPVFNFSHESNQQSLFATAAAMGCAVRISQLAGS